ncbi:MAG: hypothetical protein JST79_06345 [Acidobacteria bacterium]|nr:hypothetical protein [Acidobacteriota bacterium]
MQATTTVIGLIFIVMGGAMEGLFSLPLKYTPRWRWENTWGAGSMMALLLVPGPLAFFTIPDLGAVYAHSTRGAILLALLFGAGWGLGGVFFGLGVAAVGFSLGLSLIMGLIAAGGSLIPLLMQHPEQIIALPGIVLVSGIVLMLAGLAVVAKAGSIKASALAGSQPTTGNFRTGLLFCVAAGLLSGLVNFGFIFGAPITKLAEQYGATSAAAPNAVWALVFTANYVINIAYCLYLLWHNRTFPYFSHPGTGGYWIWAIYMGLVWAGGIVVYGMGATRVGAFGAFWGFPTMLIASVLIGNLVGVLTGEWKGAPARSKKLMTVGLVVLVVAVLVLAYSNQLMV